MKNLTPHPIRLRLGEKEIKIPPSGEVARVRTETEGEGVVEYKGYQIPVVSHEWKAIEVVDEDGEVWDFVNDITERPVIVSTIVAQRIFEEGYDTLGVYSPDTSRDGVVRDYVTGNIIAVKRLVAW